MKTSSDPEKFVVYGEGLRKKVLEEYGGACVCCDEKIIEFLGIHRIPTGTETYRRELGSYGRSIYRWLEQNGYPKDAFQILCHNCNVAKGLYGECPHVGPIPGRHQRTTRWTQARTPAIGQRP